MLRDGVNKNADRRVSAGPRELGRVAVKFLERQLGADLEHAWACGPGYLSKIGIRHACADTRELRMVESVESFRAELEPRSFAELERFVHRHVPIVGCLSDKRVPG